MDLLLNVYYLGHSAWAAETEKHYLLFDAQDENVSEGGLLTQGFVDFSLLRDKPVYIFFSHDHHDHYSPKILKMCANQANAFVFLGDFIYKPCAKAVSLKPRGKFENDVITVYSAGSTDKGVCFLIQIDGMYIFHSGDNADWGDGDQNQLYYREINYLAGLGKNIDIAFIPVCTYSGQRPEEMTRGAVYAVNKLSPRITFPMHANGREALYKKFEQDLRAAGSSARIICAGEKGLVEGLL